MSVFFLFEGWGMRLYDIEIQLTKRVRFFLISKTFSVVLNVRQFISVRLILKTMFSKETEFVWNRHRMSRK